MRLNSEAIFPNLAHIYEKMTNNDSSTSKLAAADKANIWHGLLSKVIKPKPTGASCEYCGWHGQKEDVLKSPRLNEDGVVYQINTCPSCLRNGGLVFYD